MDVNKELKDFLKPEFFGVDKELILEFRSNETAVQGKFGAEFHLNVWIESRGVFKTLSLWSSSMREVAQILQEPQTERWIGRKLKVYPKQLQAKNGRVATVLGFAPVTAILAL